MDAASWVHELSTLGLQTYQGNYADYRQQSQLQREAAIRQLQDARKHKKQLHRFRQSAGMSKRLMIVDTQVAAKDYKASPIRARARLDAALSAVFCAYAHGHFLMAFPGKQSLTDLMH